MFRIHVGSYLELFTTMYGWTLYATFFEILTITGLIYWPFLKTLYEVWKDAGESSDDGFAAVQAQKKITAAVISMLIVFSIAVLPAVQLQADTVQLNKTCTSMANGQVRTTANTNAAGQTQYGSSLRPTAGQPGIPIFWWFLMGLSSGVNKAAADSIPCLEDVRGLDQMLRGVTINDPGLRREYDEFAQQCFLPAKSRFEKALAGGFGPAFQTHTRNSYNAFYPPGTDATTPSATLEARRKDDTKYIGSHFFLQTPGYYDWGSGAGSGPVVTPANCLASPGGMCSFQATKPTEGWPIVDSRDNYDNADTARYANHGKPYCDEWWSDHSDELRTIRYKLAHATEASATGDFEDIEQWDDNESFYTNTVRVMENIKTAVANASGTPFTAYTPDEIEDIIVKRYVNTNWPEMDGAIQNTATGQGYLNAAGTVGVAAGAISFPPVALGLGIVAKDFASSMGNFYMSMWVVKEAAPKGQAILLMMIYGFLVFYLLMSSYEVENILTMAFVILAIRFFTPIWLMADYLDEALFASMYFNDPDTGAFSVGSLTEEIGSIFTLGPDRLLLDMVLMAFYVLVPAMILGLLTMAGVRANSLLGPMDGMGNKTNAFKYTGRKGGGRK